MHLQLVGWVREKLSGEPSRPILYTVSGIPDADVSCIIGYAGVGYDNDQKWYAHLYRAGDLIKDLGPQDSAEHTLRAVEEYFNANASGAGH